MGKCVKKQVGTLAACMFAAKALVVVFAASAVSAITPESIKPVSLEVKQRIQAIEQINVTAEKPVDETAPAASAEVEALLRELEELEAQDAAQ